MPELPSKDKIFEYTLNYSNLNLPYTWRQTLKDIEILSKLPSNTKAKQLNIQIKPKTLKVGIKDNNEPLFEGNLCDMIRVEESTWMIDEGILIIQLEKVNEQKWWDCVLDHHPKINTKNIQPNNSKLGDLDPEARSMVEKMLADKGATSLLPPASELVEDEDEEEGLNEFKENHGEIDFNGN